jgi:hypothetical protein
MQKSKCKTADMHRTFAVCILHFCILHFAFCIQVPNGSHASNHSVFAFCILHFAFCIQVPALQQAVRARPATGSPPYSQFLWKPCGKETGLREERA